MIEQQSSLKEFLENVGETSFWISATRSVVTAYYISTIVSDEKDQSSLSEFEKRSIEILKRKNGSWVDDRLKICYPMGKVFDPYSYYLLSNLDTQQFIIESYKFYFDSIYDEYVKKNQDKQVMSKQELMDMQMDKFKNNFHPIHSWNDIFSTFFFYFTAFRTSLIDRVFMESYEQGIRQFVIFGAGMDTRSIRMPFDATTTVYELDFPQILAFKQKVLAEAIKEIPPAGQNQTIYVPCDLSTNDLGQDLKNNGFNPNLPTLWVAEGLMFFLDTPTNERIGQVAKNNSASKSRFLIHKYYESSPTPMPFDYQDEDYYKLTSRVTNKVYKWNFNINSKEFLEKNGFSQNYQEYLEQGEMVSLYSYATKP